MAAVTRSALRVAPSSSRIRVATTSHTVSRRHATTSAAPEMKRKTFQKGRFVKQDAPEVRKAGPKTPEEEQADLERLEKSMAFTHLMPTVDAWGQQISETLDVMIPRPFDAKLCLRDPKLAYSNLKHNITNSLKSATAVYTLKSEAAENTLSAKLAPRPEAPKVNWKLLAGVFSSTSTSETAPIAPLRTMALETYEFLNEAIASGDEKATQHVTTHKYQEHALKLCKDAKFRKRRGGRMFWTMNRVVEPVQVVSLRVTSGYMGVEEPKFGNRLMIHALVKFDTEQSLEIYDSKGNPLHEPLAEGTPIWTKLNEKRESWRTYAKPKRVVEYLVFEKRAWLNGPWQFREQVWQQ